MKSFNLPAPPQPTFSGNTSLLRSDASQAASESRTPAASQLAPLDAAFLSRVLMTTLWFGALLMLIVFGATRSLAATLSFGAGAGLSLILLKSQEMFVRRVLRAKDAPAYSGWDASVPLGVLLPLKYLLIAVGIYFSLRYQLLVPAAFAAGFTLLQIVVTARVAGRVLSQRVRSVHEVYVQGNTDA